MKMLKENRRWHLPRHEISTFGQRIQQSVTAEKWASFSTNTKILRNEHTGSEHYLAFLSAGLTRSLSLPSICSSQPFSSVVGPLAGWPVDYDRAAWSWQHTAVTWMVPFTLVWWTRGTGVGAFPLAPPTSCQHHDRERERGGVREHVFKQLLLNIMTVTRAELWAGRSLHVHTERLQRGLCATLSMVCANICVSHWAKSTSALEYNSFIVFLFVFIIICS